MAHRATRWRLEVEARGTSNRWRTRWLASALWLGALALVTAGLVAAQEWLGSAHVALAYLLVVLGASAYGARPLGLLLSVIAFGCFNYFFVPPYHTLFVAAPIDWLVLGVFLVTSIVAAQLLARAQREAATARERAVEVDRLSSLGSEALNAGRAEEALVAVADVIRTTLGLTRCEIHLRDEPGQTVMPPAASGDVPPWALEDERRADDGRDDGRGGSWRPGGPTGARLVDWVADTGRAAAEYPDGTLRFGDELPNESPEPDPELELNGARAVLLPLRIRTRTVGVLRLMHAHSLALDPPRRRFLEALAYYAALGVERVRLAAEAEHADALREADRLKDALIASVSHDLRTPLTTIKALAHAIGAEGDERAVAIEEEADRLNRFVADLFDLSRLAAGVLVVAPELNTADDLLGAALQRVSGAAGGRVIDVSLDPVEPLLVGRFDFTHSLRVLVNLIENALKYSPPDTPIEIGARRIGDASKFLEFSVADRGTGVPPLEQTRIFDPFYRPMGSLPDTGSGGLGLSISRRLAEAQGGSLEYEERSGGGSRFVFRLPAADVTDLAELPLG